MDNNINFTGRLLINGMTTDKARWKNIAKLFKEETRGTGYESRVFDDTGNLEVFVDRIERKNRKFDLIDDLTTREATLTPEGTQELLSQSDETIAKILSQHLKLVKNFDSSYKKASTVIDEAMNKVFKIFKKNNLGTESINDMFESVDPSDIRKSKSSS